MSPQSRRGAFLGSVATTLLFGVATAAIPSGGGGCASGAGCSIAALWAVRFGVGLGLGGNLAVDFVLFLEYIPRINRGRASMMLTVASLSHLCCYCALTRCCFQMFGVLGVLYLSLCGYLFLERWRRAPGEHLGYNLICCLLGPRAGGTLGGAATPWSVLRRARCCS